MIDGKMLILGRPYTRGASRWLRTEQHLAVMDRLGLAFCPVLDETEDDQDLAWKAKCEADLFVSGATPTDHFFDLVEKWTSKGRKWVWDFDDDPITISPFNPAYLHYGTENVRLPDEKETWLWRDGDAGFSIAENERRRERLLTLFREQVAAITTTTEYLAQKLDTFAPDTPIYIRPNVLDFTDIWTRPKRRSGDGKVRILYQGGSSHFADLMTVLPALNAIARDYKDTVKFLFVGDTKKCAGEVIPEEMIESFDWTSDYKTFAIRMAELGPDIAIAPLCMDDLHAEFNRCKSPLKWLDAAAIGVPCVCQWETPYQEVINFGKVHADKLNGLLANTVEDWYTCIAALIENRERREIVGANAYREARSKWDANLQAERHLKEYEEILNGDHDTRRQKETVGCAVRSAGEPGDPDTAPDGD